ncbi:MAG: hypothetical protein M4D80_28620 [Myxococcota bacterium]|nr:hypothetical protein [Myxococcota bacterium]
MVAVRSAASQPLDATGAPTVGSSFIILGLIQSPRWKAYALEPRIVVDVPDLDPTRIKARSIRAGAWLLRVRRAITAGDDGAALADRIEPQLYWQRGQLAVARGAFERGDLRAALQRIRRVRDYRLVAERQILLAEIRLAVREEDLRHAATRRQCLEAVPSPAWTELVPQPSALCRHHLLMAVMGTRVGMRRGDMDSLDAAAWHLKQTRMDAPARLALLGMFARAHVDVVDALVALRTCARGGFADALLAEYLRTTRFVTPPAMALGRAGLSPPSGDIERALYDEGVALSPRVAQRRRVLISASQAWLRRTDDPSVIVPRLRTLVHAGGALAIEAVKSARRSPHADEALCLIAPVDGARRAVAQCDDRLLRLAELRGGVARGFSHAYRRAYETLVQSRRDAGTWLAALVDELGVLPEPHVLSSIAARRELPPTPRELLDDVRARVHVLASDAHDRVAPKLDEHTIDALLLAHPARVDPRMRAWTRAEWAALFTKLARRPFVEHHTLARAAQVLGVRYAELRLGQLPIPTVTSAGEVRLRLLDKRFDLLTYLRFADVRARSCYRSDCRMYRTDTQDAVLDVWQDPLTFCFHVELGGAPCGFVFGSFALADNRSCAVLSSLHVDPQRLRLPAIQALETALAPLRIEIGLANLHGGHGPMPDHFRQRARRVHRLRALGRGDSLVTTAYDDVAFSANRPELVDHLWWRD